MEFKKAWSYLALGALFFFTSCSNLKLRYDGAPSPIDTKYPSLLLEDPKNGFVFGVSALAYTTDEEITGLLNVYTPVKAIIHLYSQACGIDKVEFTKQGGVFGYPIKDLFPKEVAGPCVVAVLVRWQLPDNFETGGLEVRGMHGVVYLDRYEEGTGVVLRWLPASQFPNSTEGMTSAKFRQSNVVDSPIGLIVKASAPVTEGKWKIFNCGVTAEGEFEGEEFLIPAHEINVAGASPGECLITGALVGKKADDTLLTQKFGIGRNIFRKDTQMLHGMVEIRNGKVCYEAENSVSMVVFVPYDLNPTPEISGDLEKCFSRSSGRLGFFTHTGRAAYAEVNDQGVVRWMQ